MKSIGRLWFVLVLACAALLVSSDVVKAAPAFTTTPGPIKSPPRNRPKTSLVNPSADPSSRFGAEVRALANGNIVVTDPVLDVDGNTAAGAVYLFSGKSGALIRALSGAATNEAAAGGGVGVLTSGNFVVFSNFGAVQATPSGYAATFINGTDGSISSPDSLTPATKGNSTLAVPCLTGQPALPADVCQGILTSILTINPTSSPLDASGSQFAFGLPPVTNETSTFIPLPNGNYLVLSPGAGPGGAVTFGNGATGVSGQISSANSLLGASGDLIGATLGFVTPESVLSGTTVFPNGTYVVRSSITDTLTFASETTGATGAIPTAASMPGSAVVQLANGNFVVTSAAGETLVDGTTFAPIQTLATQGAVTPLTNGNYVVRTVSFGGGEGAVTFVNGITGLGGTVSSANSLVGSAMTDSIGSGGIAALANGNYVVVSPQFGSGVGAVTLGNGATGTVGVVSASNSLTGNAAADQLASGGIKALANGNYVVSSPAFGGGIGAATFVNGATGLDQVVSAANSLVGSVSTDSIGSGGVVALTNGNYVVVSPNWSNGAASSAGAVTFGNGTSGIIGVVSSANSLVGSHNNDRVGDGVFHDETVKVRYPLSTLNPLNTTNLPGAVALTNGNYVVMSPDFNGGIGAATFGKGSGGTVGAVTSANSLVGSVAGDHVSGGGVEVLRRGNYVVMSPLWSNGSFFAAGAATFGRGDHGVAGAVSASNSLVGAAAGDFVGFTAWNILTGLPGLPFLNSAAIYQTIFAQGGGSGNSSSDLAQFGIGSNTSFLPGQITVLSNGNYVVMSPFFNGEKGAATMGDGSRGVSGVVSAANSVLGAVPRGYFGAEVQDNPARDTFVTSGLPELAHQGVEVIVRPDGH